MKCNNIQDLLIAYQENTLEEQQRTLVEEHLTECVTCRKEYHLASQLLDDMNEVSDEQPGPEMKMDFYQMLEQEKRRPKAIQFHPNQKDERVRSRNFGEFLKYAAAVVIIFGSGILLGKNLGQHNANSVEIARMETELQCMQQNLTLATLKQPTTSQRLKAVNVLEEQIQADDKILAILVQTLQSDANVNVRMAAANALTKYSHNELVRNAFLDALKHQEEPSIQITLINILMKIQDNRAKQLFKEIMTNDNTLPVVKQMASEGIKVFV
ncbi:MAG: HEAT repeat domain-containing protein [Marinifilaceae bacterium]